MTARPRSRRLSILLLLPALLLASWFLVEQFPRWFPATPPYLQATNSEAVTGACEAVASLRAFGGTFESNEDAVQISAADSRAITDTHVATYYNISPGSYASEQGPALVRVNLPEQGERLAWLNVAVVEPYGDGQLGKAAIVYVDSLTGDVLETVTAIAVTDAQTACGGGPISRRVLLRQYAPLLALVGYGVLVVIGLMVLRLRRARVPRNRAA